MKLSKSFAFLVMVGVTSLIAPGITRADENAGPTPYPTKNEDWPGKGVVRKFDWMDDNRQAFWSHRAESQGAVVFVGDSLTGNWKNLSKTFPKFKVANRGIGGDVSRGLLFRFKEDVLDLHPKAIVILIGTNDLTAHEPATDAVSNINDILAMIAKEDQTTPVILCTVPPSANPKAPIRPAQRTALNEAILKMADPEKKISVVDLSTATSNADGTINAECFVADKVHLGPMGYTKWAELLTPVFDKLGLK